MKDVDRLLTTAFLDELERTPLAPVNKRALRDRTFEKLGLERQAPRAEWAQAVTVPRWRSLAWAAAACLVAVVAVSAAFLSTMVIAPGQVSQVSPFLGTYLELDVVDASFDESNREMVFTLEAKTDMALDDTAAMTEFKWWSTVSFFTETNGLSFEGGDTAALAQWKKTGENTYRCEGYPVEVDTETQLENHLYGDLDGTFNLQISSTSQVDSLGDDLTLSAENTFAIQIPLPQEDPTAPGTYFEASAADVSFDREQWAAVVTLEARTDMDLDSAAAQQLYSWYYSLYLRTPGGDADIGRYDGDSLEALAQWTQTGEDTYQSAPLTIPIPLSFQEEHGLSGAVQATLHLVATDLTQGEESPIQFFPEIGFSVTLPDPAEYPAPVPGTYLTAMGGTAPYVYYDQGLGILHLRAALDTDMALDHPHAGDYYSWEAQLSLTAPDGRQLTLTPLPDTPGENPQAQPTWSVEKSDDERSYFVNRNAEPSSSYDTFAFAITNTAHPEEPNYQEEYGLYGSLDGVLTLTCHETTVDGSAKDWEVEISFTAELPGREGSAPAPGTYLDSLQVTASNYAEDTGRLTLQASLASDMDLASPYAEDYYQWEAKVSLTGQQGRTCTLTAGPGQPAWQQLQKEDGSARDVFAGESLFTFDLETQGAVEKYDLYGTIQGTLTLTCRETVDGSTKDWEVEVPFTVEFPGDYYHLSF